MANVEIYKLNKHAPPEIRDYGMFEFFGMVDGPSTKHYCREWTGELETGDLQSLCGMLMLNPPDGYHGGPLGKTDIVVLDGAAYFLDNAPRGFEFHEVDFDTAGIKNVIRVEYGYGINTDGAVPLSRNLTAICVDLDIPIGSYSEPDYHGSHKGETSFDRRIHDQNFTAYLHPQFLRGDEARAFVGLLTELSAHYEWPRMVEILRDCYPVFQQDLDDVRKLFAPELLLPDVLQPFSKSIPADSDKSEVDYLATMVSGMSDSDREKFEAVMEADSYCKTLADVINTAANLDCFRLETGVDAGDYGNFIIQNEGFELAKKMESRGYPEVADYIRLLEEHFDHTAYGKELAELENGKFTSQGYLTQTQKIPETYRGTEDLPIAYRAVDLPAQTPESADKVENTDLAALLMGMHAIGGDFMRDAEYNIKSLANKGDDFFVRMHPNMIVVTPADFVYRRDMDEYQAWMLLDKTQDVRSFFMSVTERENGRITGNLYETDLYSIQDNIREHSFFFIRLDAEMKDGTSRSFTLEEWDTMELYERDQLKSWIKRYDSADEANLTAHINGIRWACAENKRPVAAGEFLSQLNAPYMAQAGNPQPGMIRVTMEAAKEILAQSAADVYRLLPSGAEELSPIDAVKLPVYQSCREYAVKPDGLAGIEKWAKRAAGDILRQNERGERDKSKNKGEEL